MASANTCLNSVAAWETMKRSGRQMKGSGRQASREPDHNHPAWETNEKNWETNKRKWETSLERFLSSAKHFSALLCLKSKRTVFLPLSTGKRRPFGWAREEGEEDASFETDYFSISPSLRLETLPRSHFKTEGLVGSSLPVQLQCKHASCASIHPLGVTIKANH